jgi:hypothetical protein
MTFRLAQADTRRLLPLRHPWTLSLESTPPLLSRCMNPLMTFSQRRYMAIFVRLRHLAPHPTNAIAGVKLALRDYTASQSGARDLISTIWSILDRDLDATASVVNLIVDFLEDEEKKTALLSAWNGFKIERRREFPDLMPTSVGTDYAGIADGRTLNAATARRAAGSRQVQDRVAEAAERGASFPALRTSGTRAVTPPRAQQTPPNFRKQSGRNTAWSASAAGVSGGTGGGGGGNNNNSNGNATSASSQGGRPPAAPPPPPAPALTDSAFPTLSGSVAPRARPIVSARTSQLQHILGSAPPTTSAWSPGRAAPDEAAEGREGEEVAVAAEAVTSPGVKKKGKQKQKQMLFHAGVVPQWHG